MGPGSTLKPLERWVAVVIASFMGKNSKAWPGYTAIAERAGMSESGVRKVLLRLCSENGIFERTRRARGFSYQLREGVPVGQCPAGTVSPQDATVSPEDGHSVPPSMGIDQESIKKPRSASEVIEAKSSTTARAVLRAEWFELIGAPSRFFDGDVLGLVTDRRPLGRVVESMRAYAASVDLSKASSRAFAQGIEGWLKRPKASEPEAYRATPEQLAAKSRRYGLAS